MKFCLHYDSVAAEGSKCVKFERGLHLEIKQVVGYQEIYHFSILANK